MQPAALLDEPSYATMYGTGFAIPAFAQRFERIEIPPELDSGFHPWTELSLLVNILRAASRRRALLICSSRGRLRVELLSIVLIGLFFGRRRPALALYGEMYERDGGLRGLLESTIIRLADHWIDRYIVYSQDECESFAATWGVARAKMRSCGHYHRPKKFPSSVAPARYVFAGGNSFRDYATLIEAARLLPEQPLRIATRSLQAMSDQPANVQVYWPNLATWTEDLASAVAVVVPLRKGIHRSIGLLAVFEAMWLNKLVIVSDTLGIREYVKDGETGLVVDGSAESYARAISWVCDPANAAAIAQMTERANCALRTEFSLEEHTRRLLAVMDELALGSSQESYVGQQRSVNG